MLQFHNIFYKKLDNLKVWLASLLNKDLVKTIKVVPQTTEIKEMKGPKNSTKILPLPHFHSYQARAERGLFTNKEDTIPGPSASIGAPKMYILEKRNFWTRISMLRF